MRHFQADATFDADRMVWVGHLVDLDATAEEFTSDDDDTLVTDLNNAAEALAGEESYVFTVTVNKPV